MTSLTPTPTLLLTSLPAKTLIGIDLLSFTTTPSFHGIKNLPPGPHFLYTGTTESFSLRNGEWFFIRPNTNTGVEIHLRKWDGNVESVVPVDERTEEGRQEAMRLRANLGRIWQDGGLLAYPSGQQQGEQRPPKKKGNRLEITMHPQGEYTQSPSGSPSPSPSPSTSTSTSTSISDWPHLTTHITPAVLSRILGNPTPNPPAPPSSANTNTESQSQSQPQPARWTISSGSSASRDRDEIPGLSAAEVSSALSLGGEGAAAGAEDKELRFLPVDLKRTWRAGAVGRERTQAAQDRSWALGEVIAGFAGRGDGGKEGEGEAQILGELQFTFLMVLTLMNFSCLEQWKRLLGLIFTCRAACKEREGFFVSVLRLVRLQLRHFEDVEGGLFEMDGDDGGVFLKKLLVGLRRVVDEEFAAEEVAGVKRELGLLEEWVKGEYGWELRRGNVVRRGMLELEDGEMVEMVVEGAEEEDEMGEYAPVVVDLGEGKLGTEESDGEEGEEVPDVDMDSAEGMLQ
ncbi:hypothetical protein FQN51_005827 [Onygenales sp. PD_10]|nr:hypothetical protein FQN51_005827 [Onygenales sp. PD_10]